MTPTKKPRPFGRIKQCNKVIRLQRRALGQWTAQVQGTRKTPFNSVIWEG